MKKRPDGRWQKSIKLPNGKRKVFYSTLPTQRQAEADIMRQAMSFKDKEEKGLLFAQVAELWEEKHYETIEYQTAGRYKTLVKHATSRFDSHYIKEIKSTDIVAFLESLSMQGYSTKTIKDQFSVIKMIFRYAMQKMYIDIDPTLYVDIPKGTPKQVRHELTKEEVKIIENHASDSLMSLFAYFLVYTGLRKSEALALQWKDIDLQKKTISVNKSIYYRGNQPDIKLPKTTAGLRNVILLDNLARMLKKGSDNSFVFSYNGKPMTLFKYTNEWKKYIKSIGINFTAHQLRHTFATVLFEAGIKEKDAQYLMGHSDISTTQNIYTHIRKNRTEETANKLNEFFSNSRHIS